jgi:hypothetical protein
MCLAAALRRPRAWCRRRSTERSCRGLVVVRGTAVAAASTSPQRPKGPSGHRAPRARSSPPHFRSAVGEVVRAQGSRSCVRTTLSPSHAGLLSRKHWPCTKHASLWSHHLQYSSAHDARSSDPLCRVLGARDLVDDAAVLPAVGTGRPLPLPLLVEAVVTPQP